MSQWPYAYEVLDVKKLFVDETYQRPLTTFVGRIERNFDPALVGTLVVSCHHKGRRYAVVDGQTRAAAIRNLAKAKKAPGAVPCLVYYGLTQADEASLFARLQKERRGIASAHRFKAAVVAGEPEAIAIEAIAARVGFEIGPVSGNVKRLSAVAALEKVYRRGPETLERVLTILREAWGGAHIPAGDAIRGLGYLLDHDKAIDDTRMAERLATVTPEHLKRRASALREGMGHGGGSDKYMAGAMAGVYHARLVEAVA